MAVSGKYRAPAGAGKTLAPHEWEAEWAPEPLWSIWIRKHSLVPAGIQIPGHHYRRVVTTPEVSGSHRRWCNTFGISFWTLFVVPW
jgi:hypothetical protein